MDELSKFVNKSFDCSKTDIQLQQQSTNKINNGNLKQNLTSTVEGLEKTDNNDNESIDIDIIDMSSSDDSKSSAEISVANFQRISVISEMKSRDKRIFCVNTNKTYMESLNSSILCGFKTKNWLLTDSFKENKPEEYPKGLAYGKLVLLNNRLID